MAGGLFEPYASAKQPVPRGCGAIATTIVRSSAPEESASSASGDVLAARKYQVLMELGRGGTAVVSAGISRGIGGFTKLVVLKTIKEEFISDRDTARMFVNEARISARMNHPNVVQVYEVYRRERVPVIVMEYLEGQSLARVLGRAFRDPRYRTDLGVAILCKVLAGLGYAHALADYDGTPLRIVHRDVSPHNVMVTYDGQVKLVDFGIAKLSATADETRTGVIKGKIGYMSPEQVEGAPLDHRADLFAAGVMLWEIVARRRLWGARSDAEIVRCLVLDEVPSLLSVEPNVDPELAGICDRALSVQPGERFASAAEFQTALEVYLARRGVVIRQHDIADLVCRTCADLRSSSALRLQGELAKFAASAPSWKDALLALDDLEAPAPGRGTTGRAWLMLASSLITVATAVGVYRFIRPEPAAGLTAAMAPQASAPEPVAAAPPAVSSVTLTLSVSPASARLYLDGRRLPGRETRHTLPRDDQEHELRAEADGFQHVVRRLRLDADAALSLTLERAAPAEPVAQRAPGAPGASEPSETDDRSGPPRGPRPSGVASEPARTSAAAPAGAPWATAPSCDPPYFIGPDGLKHYRRECL
jgi:eukaryotic-like serine/threonine-protein kinase